MKKIFVLFLILFLSNFNFSANSFSGEKIKAGIKLKNYEIHYGVLNLNSDNLTFEGKIIKTSINEKEKIQKSFVVINYEDIENVKVSGVYDNFLKLVIKKNSEFFTDNKHLLKFESRKYFISFVLYKKENIKKCYALGKNLKNLINSNSQDQGNRNFQKTSESLLLGQNEVSYIYKIKKFLVVLDHKDIPGLIKFFNNKIFFQSKLKKNKKIKGIKYKKGDVFNIEISISDIAIFKIESVKETKWVKINCIIKNPAVYKNFITDQKNIDNEIVFMIRTERYSEELRNIKNIIKKYKRR